MSDGSTYLNIYDSVFTSNTAKQGGGAIRYPSDYSAIQQVKPMRITGSTFTENKSANLGGAIFTQYDAYVTSSIFKGNSANINGSSEGGAIYSSAKLVILDSVFGAEDNGNSAKRGGALTLNGVANIVGSTFNSNTAKTDDAGDGGYGAAIYVRNLSYINSSSFTSNIADRQAGAVLSTASTQYINNSVFTGNKALDTDDSNGGGAIFTNTGSTISISNSTFSDNKAAHGGAIYNWGSANIYSSVFSNNIAGIGTDIDNNGGAILNCGNMTIGTTTFDANKVYNTTNTTAKLGQGGAIYNKAGANLTINLSTIKNSSIGIVRGTSYGGAIFNQGNATLNAVDFISNQLGSYGGAIYNEAGAQLDIYGSTFTSNAMVANGQGGAIKNLGTLNVNFSLFEEKHGTGRQWRCDF